MSAPTTIAIAGISGKLGTLIALSILSASPTATIRGFCRSRAKIPSSLLTSPRVTIFEGSSSDLAAIRAAIRGSQVVICTYLGPDDLMVDGQKLLVDACVAEKVGRYVASDYSLDYSKLAVGELPSKDPMIEIKEYLEGTTGGKGFEVKGVHVMIGCFTQTFLEYLGHWDAKENQLSHWGNGDEVWEFTTYGTCAEYVARIALDEEAVGMLHFRADRITVKQLAKVFESANKAPVTMKKLGSMEELKAKVDKARAERNIGWDTMPLFYTYFIQNGQTMEKDVPDNDRYPDVKPETFEEYLKKSGAAGAH